MDNPTENLLKPLNINTDEENSLKNKSKTRGKKRKRISSCSSTDGDDVLPENTFEMEKNLHASAIKNNLDEVSVKKILKKIVRNDHVLALVKLREEEEDSGTEESLRPKLTRAKAKELMKASPNSVPPSSTELGTKPWNLELIPIKHIPVKTRPEVTALIAQELPDDEDDDEYEPTHDDVPSDDDHVLESCSDLESQPRTPATPRSLKKASPKIVQDGPFKVPMDITTNVRRQLDLDEEATIALRTRSKLSLSETPIEHIESSFVPPDELPVADVDDLWNDFLNECLNPASNTRHEDDDETDPEYNVAADPDAKEEDEDLQLMKISKKELSDLVNELFQVMPDSTDEQLIGGVLGPENSQINTSHWEGKQKPKSIEDVPISSMETQIQYEPSRLFIGKTEPVDIEEADNNNDTLNQSTAIPVSDTNSVPVTSTDIVIQQKVTVSVEETEESLRPSSPSPPSPTPPAPLRTLIAAPKPQTVEIVVDDSVKLYPAQLLLLEQQLRQHIQLATSHFLQLYIHPVHWSYAPKFKDYVVQLNTKTVENPKSVVNVCNLKPALALMESWENSFSENSADATSMIEFLQNEVERCRRRTANHTPYIGNFHELYLKVVANSSVFLYPYLLPPGPFRADFMHKRFSYTKSEDELIVLGLDQFWRYIEDNPDLFGAPRFHPRQRWGLDTAVRLVCKYMMPWLSTRALKSHILSVRKNDNAKTPISRYFKHNEIQAVKHRLLPFNPNITLYEQPETEMPRIWIKYLGKSSKRFRDYYYQRAQSLTPAGVELELGKSVQSVTKVPLPIDFTKEITCNRINLMPKISPQLFIDKVDVHIQKSGETNPMGPSGGIQLVPLQIQTNTVNSTSTICTPVIIDSNRYHKETDESLVTNLDHCQCCVLLRKIIRNKQTYITDYFNIKKKPDKCGCTDQKYPNISNKLSILIDILKMQNCGYEQLFNKIDEYENRTDFNSKDFVAAVKFQMRLMHRFFLARNSEMKKTILTALATFNTFNGDVISLTEQLKIIVDTKLSVIYKEFIGFLTAEQADKLNVFNEYFLRNCVEDLLAKVEEQVPDIKHRSTILQEIKQIFVNISLNSCELCYKLLLTSKGFPKLAQYIYSLFPHRRKVTQNKCHLTVETDKDLQKENLENVEKLRESIEKDMEIDEVEKEVIQVEKMIEDEENVCIKKEVVDQNLVEEAEGNQNVEEDEEQETCLTICNETNATMNYEADNSSSSEEDKENILEIDETPLSQSSGRELPSAFTITKKQNENTLKITFTPLKSEELCDTAETSIVITQDEVKTETSEWQREDDKQILEILKHCFTPDQMKNKTIIDIIEDRHLLNMMESCLTHKSVNDIRDRILYLLKILVSSENS